MSDNDKNTLKETTTTTHHQTAPSSSTSQPTPPNAPSAPNADLLPTGIRRFFGLRNPKPPRVRSRPPPDNTPPPAPVAAKRPAEDMVQPSLNPKASKKANVKNGPNDGVNDGFGDSSMMDATASAKATTPIPVVAKGILTPETVAKLAKFKAPAENTVDDDDEPTFEEEEPTEEEPTAPDTVDEEALSEYLKDTSVVEKVTVTRINGIVLTAIELAIPPPEGWPTIFGANFGSLTAGLTDTSKRAWTIATGPRSIILVAFARPREEYTVGQVEELERLLKRVVPPGTKFELAICNVKNTSNGTAPQPVLLYDIHRDILNELNAQRVFSFPELTFFVFPKTFTPDTFVMTLKGLTYPANAVSEEKVTTLVRFTLHNSRPFLEWFYRPVHQSKNVEWDDELVEEWIEETINTVTTSAMIVPDGGGVFAVFRVYMAPPTSTTKHLATLHNTMKSLEYGGLRGTGRAMPTDFSCGCCRARDHPTSKCAYTSIPGFFGGKPPPKTNGATPPPTASTSTSGIITLDDDDDNAPTFDIPANTNQSRARNDSAWNTVTRGGKRGGRGGRGSAPNSRTGRGGF